MAKEGAQKGLVKATMMDTLAMIGRVVAPTFAKGPIVRRPKVVAFAQWLDLDAGAVKHMQKLREKYGTGPVLLPIPGRPQAVILDGDQARRILESAPEIFTPDSSEKDAALGHFEDKASLVSSPADRAERRPFNAAVLEEDCPAHSLAEAMLRVVDEEMDTLIGTCGDKLTWDAFFVAWNRIIRRTVLGDGAAGDEELTQNLTKLRAAANWAFMHPGRQALNKRFHDAVNAHLRRADKGSLAEKIAARNPGCSTAASHQVAHYMFAFDPGGMTAFRALGLLAVDPGAMARARQEAAQAERRELSFLRACITETLRLYPTTPAILREAAKDVAWAGAVLKKGTGILIFAPFFHRADSLGIDAHRFNPDPWIGIDPADRAPFMPFSAGPAVCPARHFVTMIASAALASILQRREVTLLRPELSPEKLPGTLNNYGQVFHLG